MTAAAVSAAAAAVAVIVPGAFAAGAAAGCGRAVIVALPGVTWEQIARSQPPAILDAVGDGAAGSMSVRTNHPRTSYSSGFATIGAGARVDGGRASGGPAHASAGGTGVLDPVTAAGVAEMRALARSAGYRARPGGLAAAAGAIDVVAIGNADPGKPVPLPAGYGRWALLAAMGPDGTVDGAATGPDLLAPAPAWPFSVRTDVAAVEAALDRALAPPCVAVVVDPGDLERVERWAGLGAADPRRDVDRALAAADRIVAAVRERLDPGKDLLLLVSPTSPAWEPGARLGVAVAAGAGFAPGSSLSSASTRRAGLVTLPDVAPTVLEHLGRARGPGMTGRPFTAVAGPRDRVRAAVALDRESVFVDGIKGDVATLFVVFQVVVYLLASVLLTRYTPVAPRGGLARALESLGLAVVAFPAATYLGGFLPQDRLGAGGLAAVLGVATAAVVAAGMASARRPLDRLLVVASFTAGLMMADLVTGARLQLNTVFGYSPIVAGRFAGAGNITFAVLGASALVTGALIAHRAGATRPSLRAAAAVFAAAVVVDGLPQFGADVGGVLALVPALGITWVLLAGRRPSARFVALAGAAAVVIVAAFLGVDLSRPADERTHLARLFEDVTDRGPSVLVDTIERKARANIRVFGSTIWTLFVPPALATLAWLLMRPRGRWSAIKTTVPLVRAGLLGGLVLAVLGFAVNDSGIVIPAVVLSFLVPLAVLVLLSLEERAAT